MPGVPPNAFEVLKKVGRSLFGRNKKKSKKAAVEPTTATGESSTEVTAPVLDTAPVAAPLAATSPVVESAPALAPVTDAPKQEEIAPVAPEGAMTDPAEVAKEPPALAVPITEIPASVDVPKIELPMPMEAVRPEVTLTPSAAI